MSLWLASLFWLPLSILGQPRAGRQELEPIRTVGAAHGLSATEAARGRPVVVRAKVTFFSLPDGAWGPMLFVSDATGGIFVELAKQPARPYRQGDSVKVTGVSAPGAFAPVLDASEIEVLPGDGVPMAPTRVTRTGLASGVFDSRLVEVLGLVHSVGMSGKSVSLRIATNEGPIVALLSREAGVDYQQFADSAVVVHGVAAPDFNQHRQMTGFHLFVQGVRDIAILARGGGDPFASPVRPIGHLASFDPAMSTLDREHFRGQATLDWPGRLFCMQDESGGLCVANASLDRIAPGATVDVAGYPVLGVAIPAVEDSVVRASGMPARVAAVPRRVAIAKVLAGEYSGELVSVQGQLVGIGSDAQNWRLTLSSDGVVYSATLPRESQATVPSRWREGSYVDVVGVCQQEEDALAEPGKVWIGGPRFKSFRILMRTEADVEVLRTPSWWTPGHALIALGSLGLLIVAIFCWVVLLRRQVEQRTRELRESERRFRHLAHHDALTGLPNRAWFHERAEMALGMSRRSGECVGLLLLDLDHFKPINDTLGHDAGDAMLCALAARVSRVVRKVDTVARLGGDEFAVVLDRVTSGEDAERVARKVLAAICRPVEIKGQMVPMSASIGVALFPQDGDSVTELLRSADLAMYESKKRARGGVCRYRREITMEEVEQMIAASVG